MRANYTRGSESRFLVEVREGGTGEVERAAVLRLGYHAPKPGRVEPRSGRQAFNFRQAFDFLHFVQFLRIEE